MRKIRIILWLMVVVCGVGLWYFRPAARTTVEADASLPRYQQLPKFELIDQEGEAFGSENLLGSAWVADCFFTSCATVCPRLGVSMAELQGQAPASLKLLSVSVDPERDTPQRMKEWAKNYGADHRRWTFLTGDDAEMRKVVQEGFRFAVERKDGELPGVYDIVHAEKLVLIDAEGWVRGWFDHDAEGRAELMAAYEELRP